MAVDQSGYSNHTIQFYFYTLADHGPEKIVDLENMTMYEGVWYNFTVLDHFQDEEGDAFNFNTSAFSKTITGLNIDDVSATVTGVPVASDIYNDTVIYLNWQLQDIHYPSTDRNQFSQVVFIYPNRAPINQSLQPDQEFDAGYLLSFSFSDTLFIDPDGDSIEDYSFGSNPDASGWLSMNATTRTFSGTPGVNDDAQNFTITVYSHDNNTYSDHGGCDFYLNIVPNEIPEDDAGLHTAIINTTVYSEFTYTVNADAFKDKESDSFSIRQEIIPSSFITAYKSTTRTVTGTLDDNTLFGDYTLKFYVEDSWNVSAYTANITFAYYENLQPVVDTVPPDATCIIAHYPLNHEIAKSLFTEPEGETMLFTFASNETSDMSNWISISDNSTHVIFTGTPNNTQFGNQTITLTIDDGHDDVADTTTTFEI